MVRAEPWTVDFTAPTEPDRSPGSAVENVARVVALVTLGGVPGLGLSVAPWLLYEAWEQSFVATATPDSAFNVFTLGIAVCVLLAAVLVIPALATLFFRTVRMLGLAYLGGLVGGVGIDVVVGLMTTR